MSRSPLSEPNNWAITRENNTSTTKQDRFNRLQRFNETILDGFKSVKRLLIPLGPTREGNVARQPRRHSDGRYRRLDDHQRFWGKVDRTSHPDGCWIWTGAVTEDGYGRFRVTIATGQYRHIKAHRWAYEAAHGPIGDGLTIDHVAGICGNPACVRPDHLEAVPLSENIRRAVAQRAGAHPEQEAPMLPPWSTTARRRALYVALGLLLYGLIRLLAGHQPAGIYTLLVVLGAAAVTLGLAATPLDGSTDPDTEGDGGDDEL